MPAPSQRQRTHPHMFSSQPFPFPSHIKRQHSIHLSMVNCISPDPGSATPSIQLTAGYSRPAPV